MLSFISRSGGRAHITVHSHALSRQSFASFHDYSNAETRHKSTNTYKGHCFPERQPNTPPSSTPFSNSNQSPRNVHATKHPPQTRRAPPSLAFRPVHARASALPTTRWCTNVTLKSIFRIDAETDKPPPPSHPRIFTSPTADISIRLKAVDNTHHVA